MFLFSTEISFTHLLFYFWYLLVILCLWWQKVGRFIYWSTTSRCLHLNIFNIHDILFFCLTTFRSCCTFLLNWLNTKVTLQIMIWRKIKWWTFKSCCTVPEHKYKCIPLSWFVQYHKNKSFDRWLIDELYMSASQIWGFAAFLTVFWTVCVTSILPMDLPKIIIWSLNNLSKSNVEQIKVLAALHFYSCSISTCTSVKYLNTSSISVLLLLWRQKERDIQRGH